MTRKEIEETHTAYVIRKHQLHTTQMELRKQFGSDNEVVQTLWNEYLKLDEESAPFETKVHHWMMQDQINSMDEEELKSFHRINR